ncbi:MAG TPA: zinc ribbon domain-containing protein [Terriglobales bacterium]
MMEHACHKCGKAVEDGVPFCPQCGAPQIRVMTVAQPGPERASSVALEGRPEQRASSGGLPRTGASRAWRAANLAAGLGALAALLVAVLTGVPQLALLLWMFCGGILAVAIYNRRQHLGFISAGMGARLGAMAGLMGFVIFGLLSLVQMLAMRGTGQLRAALEQALKASAAHSGNPEAQQMMQQFLTPEGMRLLLALGIVLMLVLFVALSSLGGAIAATIVGKRETRTL